MVFWLIANYVNEVLVGSENGRIVTAFCPGQP